MSAGLGASCGIDRDGELSCWGLGGNGIEALRDVPAPVIGLDPGTVTAGSEIEMCARTRSGRVVCWGRLRTAPERIAGLEGVVELTGGVMGMCARTGEGEVWCWNGADAPARVSLPAAARVAVGTGHACAVLRDGGVRCWGDNRRGQLGDGSTASSLVPVEVVGAEDALEVALGAEHTCARLASGRVLCWGDNDAVQLGQSGLAGSSVPVAVPVIDDAAQIAAGAQHTCAIRSDGSVACWGDDDYGQLGDGAVFGSGLGPRTALGIEDVRGLSTGARHTCALLASAAVWCWGSNERGESGQPLSRAVDVPTRVQGVSARALGSAQQTTCATELGSGLSCWGSNRWGELGDITGDRCQILCLPDSCRETDCGRPEPTRVLGI